MLREVKVPLTWMASWIWWSIIVLTTYYWISYYSYPHVINQESEVYRLSKFPLWHPHLNPKHSILISSSSTFCLLSVSAGWPLASYFLRRPHAQERTMTPTNPSTSSHICTGWHHSHLAGCSVTGEWVAELEEEVTGLERPGWGKDHVCIGTQKSPNAQIRKDQKE